MNDNSVRIISLLRLICIQILNDLSHCKGACDVKIIKNGLTYDASAALSSVAETSSATQRHSHAFSYITLSVINENFEANHSYNIQVVRFGNAQEIFHFSKVQQVVYYQCCALIG